MSPTRFMRIPFFVSGYEVTEENLDAVAEWCEGHVIRNAAAPFVLVPVKRATHKKQTEAYVGTWVIESEQNGRRSFKVYTKEWLLTQFFEVPDGVLPEILANGMDEEELGEENPTQIASVRPLPTQRNVEASGSRDLRDHAKNRNARAR